MRRGLGLGVVGILAATLLSACGDEGKPTLNWYINPDGVDTFIARADECSTDDYDIEIQMLPTSATDQRVQLARRLAAEDSSTDLMNLDPVFVAEFANAGWLAEVTDDNTEDDLASTIAESAEGEGEYLTGAANTVTWEDGVYAIPLWANTQVLWYRKSLAEAAGLDIGPDQPVTWEQVIQAAADNDGTVGVQANRYEAYVVWINALIQGAGGDIVSNTEAGTDAQVDIDSDAGRTAAEIIQMLADSPAAQPDLSVSNEGTSLGRMFPRGWPRGVHGQLDLRLQELRGPDRRARRTGGRGGVRGPRLRALPADRRGRGLEAARSAGSTSASAPTASIPSSRWRRPSASPRRRPRSTWRSTTG